MNEFRGDDLLFPARELVAENRLVSNVRAESSGTDMNIR